MSGDWRTFGHGGTAEEFLGEIIDRYREMMFRAAPVITYNDYDADDVIQKLCTRFVISGIPTGLRENPPAYLIGCILNEAKNIHRKRKRGRIDANVDMQKLSVSDGSHTERQLLDALKEAKAWERPLSRFLPIYGVK